jgi:hypothetical protein
MRTVAITFAAIHSQHMAVQKNRANAIGVTGRKIKVPLVSKMGYSRQNA